MTGRIATFAALTATAALALPASAAALVQLDRGIAGVRLGNTVAQVRAALGRPSKVRTGRNEFGRFRRDELRGGITVLYQGGRRVSAVWTVGLGDRTARGVGVGSTEEEVRTRVPGVRCATVGGFRSCHTGRLRPGRRVTDFEIRNGKVTRIAVSIVID